MGFLDKMKNKFQRTKGRAKEETGHHTRDPYLESEGTKDRVSGDMKQVGEKAKEAAKEARRMMGR
ncbi:MAG: CsbD family protein [Actinomadura rubrobrunea]|nr:CsbD family protein [Actinomadura rubrobrunea]